MLTKQRLYKTNTNKYIEGQRMKQKDFDGYTVNVFLDENVEWVAHFVEMPYVLALAETPDEAMKELVTVWEGVKEAYRQNNNEFPLSPFSN